MNLGETTRSQRESLNIKQNVYDTMSMLQSYKNITSTTNAVFSMPDFLSTNLNSNIPRYVEHMKCEVIFKDNNDVLRFAYVQEITIPYCLKKTFLSDYIKMWLVRTNVPFENHMEAFTNVFIEDVYLHNEEDNTNAHISSINGQCFGELIRQYDEDYIVSIDSSSFSDILYFKVILSESEATLFNYTDHNALTMFVVDNDTLEIRTPSFEHDDVEDEGEDDDMDIDVYSFEDAMNNNPSQQRNRSVWQTFESTIRSSGEGLVYQFNQFGDLRCVQPIPIINTNNGTNEKEGECPVCYECTEIMEYYSCSHSICEACYDEWTVNKGKTTCPMCRSKVNDEALNNTNENHGIVFNWSMFNPGGLPGLQGFTYN